MENVYMNVSKHVTFWAKNLLTGIFIKSHNSLENNFNYYIITTQLLVTKGSIGHTIQRDLCARSKFLQNLQVSMAFTIILLNSYVFI